VARAREDVVPLWLAKKLAYVAETNHPGSTPSYVNYGYENLAEFQKDEPSSSNPSGAIPAAYKLPEVCVSCNGGWMSRLEQAARLLIVGLLEGRSKELTPYDQFVLSTWMIKTCLTYDASRDPRYVPEELGSRRFFEQGYPVAASHVLIGFDPDHHPEGSFAHSRMLVDSDHDRLRDKRAVLIGFQFDQLIFQACVNIVEGSHGEDVITGMGIPLTSSRYKQIWPTTAKFEWPSEEARIRRHPERWSN
jgi:hypothetical protein